MTSSVQLEQEADQTRARLIRTLDELRERITPGQLVDQAVDYVKDSGGGLFARNLARQTADNPLPLTLIGAGVAWLMLANGRRPSGVGAYEEPAAGRRARGGLDAAAHAASERTSEWASGAFAAGGDLAGRAADTATTIRSQAEAAAQDAQSKLGNAASQIGDTTSTLYGSAKDRAGSAAAAAGGAAADAYGRVADAAGGAAATTSRLASGASDKALDASKNFLRFCREQPAVLAGIGVALGALIGALLPPTEAEDRLMGETSDALKDQAKDAARDQFDKGKAAVERGVAQARADAPGASGEAQSQSSGDAASLVPQWHEDTTEPSPALE